MQPCSLLTRCASNVGLCERLIRGLKVWVLRSPICQSPASNIGNLKSVLEWRKQVILVDAPRLAMVKQRRCRGCCGARTRHAVVTVGAERAVVKSLTIGRPRASAWEWVNYSRRKGQVEQRGAGLQGHLGDSLKAGRAAEVNGEQPLAVALDHNHTNSSQPRAQGFFAPRSAGPHFHAWRLWP